MEVLSCVKFFVNDNDLAEHLDLLIGVAGLFDLLHTARHALCLGVAFSLYFHSADRSLGLLVSDLLKGDFGLLSLLQALGNFWLSLRLFDGDLKADSGFCGLLGAEKLVVPDGK